MAYTSFPATAYYRMIEGNTVHSLGSFSMNENFELYQCQLYVVKVGAHNANDRFKIQIYPDSDLDTPIFESAWSNTVDFGDIVAGSWYGYSTFTFERSPIFKDVTYYIAIKPENVSYTVDTRYYGVKLDWPFNINGYAVSNERGAAITMAGYK